MSTAAPHVHNKETESHSVSSLLNISAGEDNWLVGNLLRRGEQMVLAGPPKTGKSRLALEIAIALSLPQKEGEPRHLFGHPQFEIPKTVRRVLFFSLEMRAGEVGGRLRRMLRSFLGRDVRIPDAGTVQDEAPFDFGLVHIFGVPGRSPQGVYERSDLEIMGGQSDEEPTSVSDSDWIRARIAEEKPDLVIYDSLVQLHSSNENDNIMMKSVMRKLRTITAHRTGVASAMVPVAHIVLHHTRKESGSLGYNPSPRITSDMMRGAGSIQAVADVLLTCGKAEGGMAVEVSARGLATDPFFLRSLTPSDKTGEETSLRHQWEDRAAAASRKAEAKKLPRVLLRQAMAHLIRRSGKDGWVYHQEAVVEQAEALNDPVKKARILTTDTTHKKILKEMVGSKEIEVQESVAIPGSLGRPIPRYFPVAGLSGLPIKKISDS